MIARHRYPFLAWRERAAMLVLDALGEAGAVLRDILCPGPPRPFPAADVGRVRSIVVFGCLAVGDSLTTTPALRALRRSWPGARITLVTPPAAARILEGNPHVDRLLAMDLPWLVRCGTGKVLGRWVQTLRLLARPGALQRSLGGPPDVCVIFAPDVRTFLLAMRLGARLRVGHTFNGGGWLLTHPVDASLWDGRHIVEHRLDLARAVGAPPYGQRTELAVRPQDARAVEERLRQQGLTTALRVALAPGAGGQAYKRWPPEHFAAVGNALVREFGAAVLVVGTPEDRQAVAEVLRAARLRGDPGGQVPGPVQDWADLDPAAVIARCRLVISNDTGTMHVARALGAATVTIRGLYRPGDARLWGYDQPDYARLSVRMERGSCRRGRCGRCADVACMAAIGPEAVLDICRRLVNGAADRRVGMIHEVLPAPIAPSTAKAAAGNPGTAGVPPAALARPQAVPWRAAGPQAAPGRPDGRQQATGVATGIFTATETHL